MKFHRQIGFPTALSLPEGRTKINPSDHSKNRSENHKHGEFDIPDEVFVHEKDIVEVKTANKELYRYLIRTSYNETFDLCIVLEPAQNEVVTAWRNKVSDTHDTLDKSQYDHPSDF